MKVRKLESS